MVGMPTDEASPDPAVSPPAGDPGEQSSAETPRTSPPEASEMSPEGGDGHPGAAGGTPLPTHEPVIASEPATREAQAPLPEPEPPSPAAASVADDQEHSLDPRYIDLARTIGWIVAASIFAGNLIGAGILILTPAPTWVKWLAITAAMIVTAALAWFFHHWPAVYHYHSSYRVNMRGIEIRRGVIWRKVINVPRSRVQHTDVSQGPIERQFGLSTLLIHTAGTEHAQVDLPGLDRDTALKIRDHLVSAREQDDAV